MIVKLLLEQRLKEDNNEIPAIEIPYEDGDKKKGYLDALNKLAASLFGKKSKANETQSLKDDPRLKPIPSADNENDDNDQQQSDDDKSQPNNNQNNSKNKDKKNKKTPDKSPKHNDGTLSREEVDKLIDKIKETRNKLDDVIDDNDNKIDHNSTVPNDIEKSKDELNKLEDDAKEAESAKEVNGIKSRLQKIADFWDDEDNVKQMQSDAKSRTTYKELQKQLIQAKRNAQRKDSRYRPATISEIVNNISRTIKDQTSQYRDSDWSHYNNRSDELGYLAPGRFTAEKYNKPKVVFYFDVSGSWCYNKEKIDMGHRIEEALKKLNREGRIDLKCLYFGTRVNDQFTTKDQGNSAEPIPHALELLEYGELDNLIIMTDNDPWCDKTLKVPGYVWLLFYDDANENFATHVSGQKGTTIFMIQH